MTTINIEGNTMNSNITITISGKGKEELLNVLSKMLDNQDWQLKIYSEASLKVVKPEKVFDEDDRMMD